MSPPFAVRTWIALLATPLLAASVAPRASAQSYTWVGSPINPNWSVTSNWSSASAPNTVPNGAGATVLLNGSSTANAVVDGAFTIGELTFNQSTSFSQSVIAASFPTAGSLTLNNGGSASLVQVIPNGNGAGNGYFGVPATIGGTNSLTLLAPQAAFLYLAGTISGTGSDLAINAGGQTGTVALISETNAYGGTGSVTTVNGGVLQATDGGGLPTNSALALNNAVWLPGYGPQTITKAVGTGDGELRLTGGAAGFAAGNATLTIRLGNGTGTITWGTPAFNPAALVLGQSAEAMTVLENGLDLNGANRTVRSIGTASPGGLISGTIANSAGTAGLVKDGSGMLTLTGANTYNGATTIQAGVLRANDGVGLPTAGNLNLQGGVLESIGNASFNRFLGIGAGQVQFTGGGLSASGGTLTVRLNNGTNTVAWGSAGFVAAGQPLRFGSTWFDGVVDFRNGLDLVGTNRAINAAGPGSGAAGLVRMTGAINNGGLIVNASPGATIELAATNNYSGQTLVQGGALRATNGVGLPTASNLNLAGGVLEGIGTTTFDRSLGTGANQVQIGFSGGFSASGGPMTVQLNGGTGTLGWSDLSGTGSGSPFRLQFGSRTADNLTNFRNGLNLGAEIRNIGVDDNVRTAGDLARLSGAISGTGFNKLFSGTLELTASNSFSHATVSGGAIRAADGVGLPATATLSLQGGVFEGLGPATFTRTLGTAAGQVHFAGSGGFSASGGTLTVQLNGGAALTWGTSPSFVPGNAGLLFGSATANDVATLQNNLDLGGGTRTAIANGNPGYAGPVGRISGVISNGALNVNNVSQSQAGTLELTAANTYVGGTAVNAGRLLVNNSTGSGTGTGGVIVGGISPAALGGGGRIAPDPGNSVSFYPATRVEPGSGSDASLRIETRGGGRISIGLAFPGGHATWAVRITSAGTGGVAANSGGSSVGTVPDPTNHTFLDLSGGGSGTVDFAPNNVIEVDGTGAGFVAGEQYSYQIGRVGAGELSGGPLNLTGQSNFVFVGLDVGAYSLTSDADGDIFLNFSVTPVPEPSTLLLAAAAGLGLLTSTRRLLGRTR